MCSIGSCNAYDCIKHPRMYVFDVYTYILMYLWHPHMYVFVKHYNSLKTKGQNQN